MASDLLEQVVGQYIKELTNIERILFQKRSTFDLSRDVILLDCPIIFSHFG